MKSSVWIFATATLVPVALLVFGALFGGAWLWAALIYLTVFSFAADELVAITAHPDQPEAEFPAAERLSQVLGVAHFSLLVVAIAALAGQSGLGWGERVLAFVAFGLFFGQVSNSNAHELIHRTDKVLFSLGQWVFISLLFGHHTSAHRLLHHPNVATKDDPNSARLGESFYRFAPRAWVGSFRAGLRAESARDRRGRHPYNVYVVGGLAWLLLAWVIGGAGGVIAYLLLSGYAVMQLLLSDYVQHYGLVRQTDADGRVEQVAARHSWNAPHWFSGLVMLHSPRHSDHHNHPGRAFPALQLELGAPMLPHSLPIMGLIALWPKRWRKLMDPRVAELQAR